MRENNKMFASVSKYINFENSNQMVAIRLNSTKQERNSCDIPDLLGSLRAYLDSNPNEAAAFATMLCNATEPHRSRKEERNWTSGRQLAIMGILGSLGILSNVHFQMLRTFR